MLWFVVFFYELIQRERSKLILQCQELRWRISWVVLFCKASTEEKKKTVL